MLPQRRSIIPACDVDEKQYEQLVRETCDVEAVSAYKLGFMLGLSLGLPRAVEIARRYTNKPLIYDHQKAGTDIPDTGKLFARTMKQAGINIVILFPQAGPDTERAWIQAMQDEGLGVMVGGVMTHKGYKASDGGWIRDESIDTIYQLAVTCKVNDFVVPGTSPETIARIRNLVVQAGCSHPSFSSPGIGAQGGQIEQAAQAAGTAFHAIVGRAIYGEKNMNQATQSLYQRMIS